MEGWAYELVGLGTRGCLVVPPGAPPVARDPVATVSYDRRQARRVLAEARRILEAERPAAEALLSFEKAKIKTYAILSASGRVKIGRSQDPRERLHSLQTASPDDLLLLHVWNRDIESELHALMRPWALRGEWFQLAPQVIDILQDYGAAISENGKPDPSTFDPLAAARLLKEWALRVAAERKA